MIERYAPWLESTERLGGAQLEIVVAAWLSGLASGRTEPLQPLTSEFEEIGFLDTIQDARILSEVEV